MSRPLPFVIAHRGASGYRPEHTLASYTLAIEMGADFIEPDLVSTRDGVLVARHENELSSTTDVVGHAAFANRRTTKRIDGRETTGWFTEDFTLAELKMLRARERIAGLRPENALYDGLFEVPTLQEIIDLAARFEEAPNGRRIGLYPETKHPGYFRHIGLALEGPLDEVLRAAGYSEKTSPVFIQSFEPSSLRHLAALTPIRLVQLIDASGSPADEAGPPYSAMTTAAGLAQVAAYAAAIGVHKDLIYPRDSSGSIAAPSSLIGDAHAAGLDVHTWTFRAENAFLPSNLRRGNSGAAGFDALHGDLAGELRFHAAAAVDAVFTDHPDIAKAAFELASG